MIAGPARHLKVEDFIREPQSRGYSILYRPDSANPCPGCSRSHWLVGRTTAECAFCATAIPIQLHPAAAPPVKA